MKRSILILALSLSASLISSAITKVACVGDSITFGMTIPNSEGKYPYILGQLLGSEFDVKNFGNSGKTAGDFPGQPHRAYAKTNEHKSAVEFAADIYICNLGINDTGAWWDPKLFEQGYKQLIEDWRSGNKKAAVYAWGKLGPDYRGPEGKKNFPGNVFGPEFTYAGTDNDSAKNRPAAERIIQKLAKPEKLLLLDAYTPLSDKPQWYKDGLHPNADGANRIAEITFAKLARTMKLAQPKPVLSGEGTTLTVENKGDSAILMDGWTLTGGAKKWVFEKDTVIHPQSSITITMSDKSQTDPTKELECPIKGDPKSFRLVAPRQ